MISISVCDDDKLELTEINKLVNEFLSEKHIQFEIQAFDSSINLLYELSDNRFSDIYILDVLMPGKNGFSVAEEIRKLSPNSIIIFLTSHSEFAPVGYLYEAHRYVLKLRIKEDLPEALTSAVRKLPNTDDHSVIIRRYNDVWKIPYSDIVSVTRVGRQLQILTVTQEAIQDSRGIREFFDLLNDERFLFIDRGCFINIDFASKVTGAAIKLTTGHILPISRRSMQSVKAAILHRWGT